MTNSEAFATLPRLLLIDDDEISREVLSMMLELHGFPIGTAEDGALALVKLDADPVEVILMDTQMPGMSGLALIDAIRQRSSARIIAISGSDVSEAIKQATDGFLLKPVEADDLVKLLATREGTVSFAETTSAHPRAQVQDQVIDPVIDPAVLGRLTAMMPAAAVREIYDAVAADLKKRLVQLGEAMNAGNVGEVSRIAHSIKGGSAMVGFTMATEAASRLESINLSETWSKELLQLQDALQALESILGGEFPT